MLQASDREFRRAADDLRGTWQGRALAAASGRLMLVVSSMLAHAWPDHIKIMLQVVQPRCWDVERDSLRKPFLTSLGKIDHHGRIVADVWEPGHVKPHEMTIFRDTGEFQGLLRGLADRIKLDDADRVELFKCAHKWLAADRRIDPVSGEKRLGLN